MPDAVRELLITGVVTLEEDFVTMMLSKKALFAVLMVEKVTVVFPVPAEKCRTLASKLPPIMLVYVTFCVSPFAVTVIPPAEFHPLTSKLTSNAPPLRSKALLVIEPTPELEPNFTSPPAEKALVEIGKFAVRLLVTSVVDGEDSVPVVSVAKFSLNKIGMTTKSVALVPVPKELVTEIFPLVAVPGTVVVIWVALSTVKVAEIPLNLTAFAPAILLPVNTTKLPGAPLAGLKEVMEETAVSAGKMTI